MQPNHTADTHKWCEVLSKMPDVKLENQQGLMFLHLSTRIQIFLLAW